MPASETPRHLELKRLALGWAQLQGFRIAGTEVSLPHLRVRLDVAACRAPKRSERAAVPLGCDRAVGATAIFECKQHRSDFLRDSRSTEKIGLRLRALHERRKLYESSLPVHLPSLRKGESLFPEFDGCRFEEAGFEPYDTVQAEIRQLTAQLHKQTKFAKLLRWGASNLHYVVVEDGVAEPHELPPGWGLLIHLHGELQLAAPATWQEISAERRFELLLRIAMTGTRAVSRQMGVDPVPWSGLLRDSQAA
ncbi:MAG TPA: hypothetical protein VF614_07945 [Chthoniobacteraceae bacterium]|jgi:hypothetical protein